MALWPGIDLGVWVHDFNFRHLERSISALRRRKPFKAEHHRKLMQVHLTISAFDKIQKERIVNWLAFDHCEGLDISYNVEDAHSGHAFPATPPMYSDLAIFSTCAHDFIEAGAIYHTVELLQIRRFNRCYRPQSHDPSKQDRFMKWIPGRRWQISGSYEELQPREPMFGDGEITEIWID